MQQLFGGVVERIRGGSGRDASGDHVAPRALTALDVGTEFAKALVVSLEDDHDVVTGVVRGAGRRRQGLAHMQSGTVSDIDAVVANCRAALDEAEAMAGLRPGSAVIGIAGELVKGTTSVRTLRREQPQNPLTDAELERIVQ
ncbi:MAG TPA: hypothetical protein VFH98_05305, partial [Candidatus Limnocylindria bacterium]|nr:hypothetical protein [Candidatus Limnocylindria bacterium]